MEVQSLDPYFRSVPDDVIDRILSYASSNCVSSKPSCWSLARVSRRFRSSYYRCIVAAVVGSYRPRTPHVVPQSACNAAALLLEGPLRKCIGLRRLVIGCCDGLSDDNIVPFAISASRSVTELILQGCNHITDASAMALVHGVCSEGMESLELTCHPANNDFHHSSQCAGMTDVGLACFAKECSKIRALHLWMWDLGDAGSNSIASMHNLRRLKLRGVFGLNDTRFATIVAGCCQLEEIILANAPELTNDAGKALACCPAASSLACLQIINNANITDEFLDAISLGCTFLEEIYLGTCHRITDSASCCFKAMQNLQRISIVSASQVTDNILVGIYSCRQLRYLSLDFCANITSAGLAPLTRLPYLEELSLCFCPNLGLNMANVLAACPALRRVELTKTNMDDEAIEILMSSDTVEGGQLQSLDVRQCPNVSPMAIRDAGDRYPHLTILSDHGTSDPARTQRDIVEQFWRT